MNKILFLDLDGVLNTFDNLFSMSVIEKLTGKPSMDSYGHLFDDRCVNWLEYIILNTKCKIVISSTWRRSGLDNMKKMWEERNLPGEVIDITPTIVDKIIIDKYKPNNINADRGYEIQQWIDNNDIETYCIVDDDSDMLSHQNFVKVDGKFGLEYISSNKIINILNNI